MVRWTAAGLITSTLGDRMTAYRKRKAGEQKYATRTTTCRNGTPPRSPLLHDKGGPTRMLPPTAGAAHTSGPAERELVTTSHAHYNLHHMMTFMM